MVSRATVRSRWRITDPRDRYAGGVEVLERCPQSTPGGSGGPPLSGRAGNPYRNSNNGTSVARIIAVVVLPTSKCRMREWPYAPITIMSKPSAT